MKIRKTDTFTIVFLKDKLITDDLEGVLIVSCSNKTQLEKITGIAKDRLVYIFTKLKKLSLTEKGMFIIKSKQFYKGGQVGGLRNPALIRGGNDY